MLNFLKFFTNYKKDNILAIYDLEKASASYAFIEFFQNAFFIKEKLKIKKLDILIISGTHNGFKTEQFNREKNHKEDFANIRLYNIVFGMIFMLKKHINNFFFLNNRNDFYKFKKNYKIFFPENYKINLSKQDYTAKIRWKNLELNYKKVNIAKFKIFKLYEELIKKKINQKKTIITITLRESSYNKERNNNLKNILYFTQYLKKKNYLPIIIRDNEKIYQNDSLKKYEIFPEANHNIMFRSALYKISRLNLFSSNGPQNICAINNINSIAFKSGPSFYPKYREISGIIDGRSKIYKKNIKLLDLNDSKKNLIFYFNKYIKK